MPSTDRSSENRRINKPVMEKKRRARINNCLNQLKSLVLEGMKKDPARHSKLEKADILEMAVKHMKSLNSSRSSSGGTSARFQEGYADCARQVASYLNTREELELELKQRLMVHLASSYRAPSAPLAPAPAAAAAAAVGGAPQVLSSLQLVPTLLPSGEVGYIIQPPAARALTVTPAVVQPAPASVGSPSPVPSSPAAAAESCGWEEALSPASSVRSSSSAAAAEYGRSESPQLQPLALVAHNRGEDESCWRPW